MFNYQKRRSIRNSKKSTNKLLQVKRSFFSFLSYCFVSVNRISGNKGIVVLRNEA